jgi:hypothetical protein
MLHLLKCWIVGLAFSLLIVASEASGPHTPFGILAIVFGVPLFILTAAATGGHRNEDNVTYALMAVFGSIFYGLLIYVLSAFFRWIKKPGTHI